MTLSTLFEFLAQKSIFIENSIHIHSDLKTCDEEKRQNLLKFLPKSNFDTYENIKLCLIWMNATKFGQNLSFETDLKSGKYEMCGELSLYKFLVKKFNIFGEIDIKDETVMDEIYKMSLNEDLKQLEKFLEGLLGIIFHNKFDEFSLILRFISCFR